MGRESSCRNINRMAIENASVFIESAEINPTTNPLFDIGVGIVGFIISYYTYRFQKKSYDAAFLLLRSFAKECCKLVNDEFWLFFWNIVPRQRSNCAMDLQLVEMSAGMIMLLCSYHLGSVSLCSDSLRSAVRIRCHNHFLVATSGMKARQGI
jgi:hypothetical protein